MLHKFVLTMVALALIAGCSTMPKVTRTGQIHDVMIRDQVQPAQLTVQKGDEIRWINRRNGEVTIIFLQPISEKVACAQGFSGWTGVKNRASLAPNESASICFNQTGSVPYTVRMDTNLPSGELNTPGTIRVEQNLVGAGQPDSSEMIVEGEVLKVQSNFYVLRGRDGQEVRVFVTPDTRVEDAFEVGDRIQVETSKNHRADVIRRIPK